MTKKKPMQVPTLTIQTPMVMVLQTQKMTSHSILMKTPTPMATALGIMPIPTMITTGFPIMTKEVMEPTP